MSPPSDGVRHRPNGTTSVGAVLLVLAAVLGVWFVNGAGDPGTPTGATASDGPVVGSAAPAGSRRLPTVALDELPGEAADTVALIDAGGPFPEDEDGGRFGNYEGLLPARAPGYYSEYTVPTPGAPDRGARRIVAGEDGALYWTADHYASFALIER